MQLLHFPAFLFHCFFLYISSSSPSACLYIAPLSSLTLRPWISSSPWHMNRFFRAWKCTTLSIAFSTWSYGRCKWWRSLMRGHLFPALLNLTHSRLLSWGNSAIPYTVPSSAVLHTYCHPLPCCTLIVILCRVTHLLPFSAVLHTCFSQHSATWHNKAQYNTVCHDTTWHGTTWHSTTRHST